MKKYLNEEFDDVLVADNGGVDIYKYSDIIDKLVAERKKMKKIIEELEIENEELRKQEIKIPKHMFYIVLALLLYIGYLFKNEFVKFEKDINEIKSEMIELKTLNRKEIKNVIGVKNSN